MPTIPDETPTTTAQIISSQVCKIDISKFPQYYFLLKNDINDYTLIMYSCVFTTILLILFVIWLLIGYLGGSFSIHFLFKHSKIALFIKLLLAAMLISAWAGFIKLIIAVNDYQKISKKIKILNNPKVNNCNVIISTDPKPYKSSSSNHNIFLGGYNVNGYQIFTGSYDAIQYIKFSTVLLIMLYTIISPFIAVLAIMSIYELISYIKRLIK